MKQEVFHHTEYQAVEALLRGGAEQSSGADTYEKAFGILFDLSDGGLDTHHHDSYIVDSKGKEVFALRDPDDLQQLRIADSVGLLNVEFINNET